MKLRLSFVTMVVLTADAVLAFRNSSNCSKAPQTTTERNNNTNNSNIARRFREAEITPYIIPAAPRDVATIRYTLKEACFGEELSPSDVIYRPMLIYRTEPGVNYTIILLDLDFPSDVAPSLSPTVYWLVVNVPGTNLSGGYDVAVYVPPVNYPGSGCHRFVFLVYAQDDVIDTTDRNLLRIGVERFRFSTSAFAEGYGLGEPIAGNFFRTCIPQIRDQFYCQG